MGQPAQRHNNVRTLILYGHVPAKKNRWRSRNGGVYIPSEVAEQVNSLTMQAEELWGDLPTLEHPELTVRFVVRNRKGDRDNKLTTVLDCLQGAKVIRNDNVAHCNGRIILEPAIIEGQERTIIEVLWN